jgi:hypothetical protein
LARDVSAGPPKARHEAELDGVATRGHNDRRRPGGALSGLDTWCALSHDHVYLALNQIGSQIVKTRNVVRSSRLNRDVLAVDVAALPQCLPKGGNAWIGIAERTGQQHADPRRLPRSLGLGSERRSDEAERENEPNQTNGHAPSITQ